jgi:hypothetical protein
VVRGIYPHDLFWFASFVKYFLRKFQKAIFVIFPIGPLNQRTKKDLLPRGIT